MSEILKIAEAIKSGKTTARKEVEAAIKRAEEDKTNAILEVIRERALKRADEIDAKIAKGKDAGKLAGVPFVAKDNFLTLGSKTTAASKILESFEAPLQATAIEKLEAEGAICIGKANLDSFAHGGSTENSAFGVTQNAIDGERVAGGSSGGSAVAVANGIVPFALGSDTGGSIRQPASFNGVVGFKPTYGMISRYGVVAMASSTDVVGPIAKTIEDVQVLCEILAGQDGKDSTVFEDYFGEAPIKAVLIHGTDGSPESNWLPWLKGKLEELGVKVFVPTMPIGDEQNLDNWCEALRKQVPFEFDGNTILIGHSNGAAHMLSILNQDRKVPLLASVLVSGFYSDLPGVSQRIRKCISTFVDLDFDWDKIRQNAGKVIQFHGDNDPYVPLSHAEKLSDKLGSNLSVIKKGAHLNSEIGMTEFLELLKEIKKIFKCAQNHKIPHFFSKENPPRADKEFTERKFVQAFVYNPKTDKYLAIKWKKFPWVSTVGGGVDGDEDVIEAARREVLEETGYKNLKFERVLGKYTSEFYAENKDVNRKTDSTAILFTLEDDEQAEVSAEEKEIQEPIWLNRDEFKQEDMPAYDETMQGFKWVDQADDAKNPKIGLIKQFIGDGVDKSVRDKTFEFVKKMRQDGYEVDEVDLPMAKYALPIYYIVTPAEISSNMARYDGIRYGLRSGKAKDLAEVYGKSRAEGFVDETKRRIMIGSYVLSSGFFDAYYLQAQKARTLLINEFNKLFEEYDFLIGPVAPTPAYKIGENINDPLKMYMADIMTCPASLAGLPALSLPVGTDENDLPIGVQIIGAMKSDARLLDFAKEVEK